MEDTGRAGLKMTRFFKVIKKKIPFHFICLTLFPPKQAMSKKIF